MLNKSQFLIFKFQKLFEYLDFVIRYCLGFRILILEFGLLALLTNCAYFNTYYNASNYFRQGMKGVQNDTLKYDNENFNKTIEKTTSVIVKYPRSRYVDNSLFMMGVSYYYKGDYARAIEKLEFLILNYPQSNHINAAHYYKALAYLKTRKYSPAVIALKESMKSKKYRDRARLILCYVYYQDNNYSALNQCVEELLSSNLEKDKRQVILKLVAEASHKLRKYEPALSYYNELLNNSRTGEEKKKYKSKIAKIYLEMGEYESCRNFLEGESDVEFQEILGDLCVKLVNYQEAKDIYLTLTASKYGISAAEVFFKLSEIYRQEDSIETAIAYYDSAYTRGSTSEYGIKAKKMSDVLRRIQSLGQETENLDRAQFLRAETYYVDFNDPQRAAGEYKKVYDNYPKSEWAPKALYAHFWIAIHELNDDSLSNDLSRRLMDQFPATEYSMSAAKIIAGSSGYNDENAPEP
ncbi:hypothetical protein A2Y85_00100 [candidate division WOR-3 bacterium RBG_13_43_14]|uniref:Outer membrane lipoprotein BamD-like domain-containing protein n=1 Tax=candidate division WOR-3 bacterium RBG_13_43_14 TaxID=1802590 RepID=A0A1F4UEW2_UNCW3|nr:MAG: hypothetical protein A2Y85_00100 [candidate division WOR-3 bacterium RBG_13_43_14]